MLSDNPNIKVAQYYTKLPDKKVLSEKLKKAVAIAKEHCCNLSHEHRALSNSSQLIAHSPPKNESNFVEEI